MCSGIGHLVGVDADVARRHARIEAMDVVGRPGRPVLAEGRAHARCGELDEGVAAAGLHLHQQRLALVQRHAARIADRLAAPVARQAGFVEAMAGLVQHAHQGAREVGFVVARGDAHVVGRAAGEGMRRDVEPAVREVEAEHGGIISSPSLRCCSTGNGPSSSSGLPALACRSMTRPRRSGRKARSSPNSSSMRAERPPGSNSSSSASYERGAERGGLGLADAAHHGQHLAERRQQRLEVGVLLGLAPDHLAGRAGAGARLDQVGRQRAFVDPEPPHLAQVGGAPAIESLGPLLRPRQQLGHVGGRDHAVGDHAQGRELVGAVLAGARRHHGRAVPVQDRAGAIDGAQPREAAFELGIGIVGDHGASLGLTLVRPATVSRPFSQ